MRYIEVVGGIGVCRMDLNMPLTRLEGFPSKPIGEFTRENVARFLEVRLGPEFRPIEDFHAVCDDIDIPWATEKAKANR